PIVVLLLLLDPEDVRHEIVELGTNLLSYQPVEEVGLRLVGPSGDPERNRTRTILIRFLEVIAQELRQLLREALRNEQLGVQRQLAVKLRSATCTQANVRRIQHQLLDLGLLVSHAELGPPFAQAEISQL